MIWPFSLLKKDKDKKIVKNIEDQAKDAAENFLMPSVWTATKLVYKTLVRKK